MGNDDLVLIVCLVVVGNLCENCLGFAVVVYFLVVGALGKMNLVAGADFEDVVVVVADNCS